MYMIGYIENNKLLKIFIDANHIDFNTYKPEFIYYINKYPEDKTHTQICLYHSEFPNREPELIIKHNKILPKLYEPLSAYDIMLIYGFNGILKVIPPPSI